MTLIKLLILAIAAAAAAADDEHCFTGNTDTCQFTCHCMDNLPCDTTNGTCPNGCEVPWTGSACHYGNVAAGGDARVVLVDDEEQRTEEDASGCVDGVRSEEGGCCEVPAAEDGYLEIDLRKDHRILDMLVYLASETEGLTAQVELLSSTNVSLVLKGMHQLGDGSLVVSFDNRVARYVRFSSGSALNGARGVCEVVVEGYQHAQCGQDARGVYHYGPMCGASCNQGCDEPCWYSSTSNGSPTPGCGVCKTGWDGDQCEEPLPRHISGVYMEGKRVSFTLHQWQPDQVEYDITDTSYRMVYRQQDDSLDFWMRSEKEYPHVQNASTQHMEFVLPGSNTAYEVCMHQYYQDMDLSGEQSPCVTVTTSCNIGEDGCATEDPEPRVAQQTTQQQEQEQQQQQQQTSSTTAEPQIEAVVGSGSNMIVVAPVVAVVAVIICAIVAAVLWHHKRDRKNNTVNDRVIKEKTETGDSKTGTTGAPFWDRVSGPNRVGNAEVTCGFVNEGFADHLHETAQDPRLGTQDREPVVGLGGNQSVHFQNNHNLPAMAPWHAEVVGQDTQDGGGNATEQDTYYSTIGAPDVEIYENAPGPGPHTATDGCVPSGSLENSAAGQHALH